MIRASNEFKYMLKNTLQKTRQMIENEFERFLNSFERLLFGYSEHLNLSEKLTGSNKEKIMAEKDDLTMRVEQLEADNKRLKIQLRLANKEIDRCHKTIDRYEKTFHAEANLLDECAKNLRMYSDNIQELYEQGK